MLRNRTVGIRATSYDEQVRSIGEADLGSLSSLSVVIPVRNAERELERQLGTLQAWPGIEVVIVNDGSSDSTLDLASRYAARLDEWVVVESPSRGPGAARNAGLRHATREFICFLDVDDELVQEGVSVAIAAARLRQADTVLMAYEEVHVSDGSIPKLRRPAHSRRTAQLSPERAARFTATCWAKVFKRDFLLSLSEAFPDTRCGEDVVFTARVFSNSRVLEVISDVGYRHRTGLQGQLTGDPGYLNCAAQSIRLLMAREFRDSKRSRAIASYAGISGSIYLLSRVRGIGELGVPIQLWIGLSRIYGIQLALTGTLTFLLGHLRRRVEPVA